MLDGEDVGMSDALEVMKSNVYVDGDHDSAKTVDEAINISTKVKTSLATSDFHLADWQSNVPAFVEAQQLTGEAPNRQ